MEQHNAEQATAPCPERGAGQASAPERGAGLAEYSLLLLLIAMVCIAALTTLGGAIAAALTNAAGIFG
jgi:Flp pilus assembly pilin Flp